MQPREAAPSPSEFRPVEGGGETASAGGLLVAAYLLMWALVFGMVAHGVLRQRKLAERLSRLEQGAPGPSPRE